MHQVTINQIEYVPSIEPKTWGDLLAELDREAVSRAELVTAVRIDGVEDPAFREPGRAAMPLAGAAIDVEMVSPRALVAEALDEAKSAIVGLGKTTEYLYSALRSSNPSVDAHFSDLANGVHSLTALLGAISTAAGYPLAQLEWHGTPLTSLFEALVAHLQSVADARQTGDTLTAADILEYDLKPSLDEWPAIVDALYKVMAAPPRA